MTRKQFYIQNKKRLFKADERVYNDNQIKIPKTYKIKKAKEELFDIKYALDLLLFKIDLALIENNQTDFMKYSKKYKYLKLEV